MRTSISCYASWMLSLASLAWCWWLWFLLLVAIGKKCFFWMFSSLFSGLFVDLQHSVVRACRTLAFDTRRRCCGILSLGAFCSSCKLGHSRPSRQFDDQCDHSPWIETSYDDRQGLLPPMQRKTSPVHYLQSQTFSSLTVPPKIVLVNLPGLNMPTTLRTISVYWL